MGFLRRSSFGQSAQAWSPLDSNCVSLVDSKSPFVSDLGYSVSHPKDRGSTLTYTISTSSDANGRLPVSRLPFPRITGKSGASHSTGTRRRSKSLVSIQRLAYPGPLPSPLPVRFSGSKYDLPLQEFICSPNRLEQHPSSWPLNSRTPHPSRPPGNIYPPGHSPTMNTRRPRSPSPPAVSSLCLSCLIKLNGPHSPISKTLFL
jgi:hypothetical protein